MKKFCLEKFNYLLIANHPTLISVMDGIWDDLVIRRIIKMIYNFSSHIFMALI